MKKFCLIIIVLFPLFSFSQGLDRYIDVHFYPHSLTPQDILQDGQYGKKLEILEESLFIWIDLMPRMFFTHKTAYILISKENIRIEMGNWWPTLNGKTILYGKQNKIGIISPFKRFLLSLILLCKHSIALELMSTA